VGLKIFVAFFPCAHAQGGEALLLPASFGGVLKNFASPLFTGFFLNNADVSYLAIENIGY
jgi:hypothetical protein